MMSLLSRGLAGGYVLLSLLFLTGCGVNSNLMFKEPKGLEANSDSIPLFPKEDYRIAVDDKFTFTLATNDGKTIIDRMAAVPSVTGGMGNVGAQGGANQLEYVVRQNGFAELPVLGEVKVLGLTIQQCEDTLEYLFSKEFADPFVQVRITNKRVIIFPGTGSDARVVSLVNNNTTLMEVIASAGGIPERGRARAIKLMRKEGDERKVYKIDLSTIEGLKYADMIVQGNDYIYIDPNPELARELLKETAPILSILSTSLAFFAIFRSL